VAALCGCTVGPDYKPVRVDVPDSFRSNDSKQEAKPLAPDWWTLFADPELADLESESLKLNNDLQAAVSRVVQARAATSAIQSQYYPVISLDPSITRARSATGRSNAGGSTTTTVQIPFDLSYEIDVWGRVRREVEASEAQARASVTDYGVVLLTLTADVAQNYFTLRSLDAQERILSETIDLFRQQVDLTKTRQGVGIAASTDTLQAQVQVDTAEAQLVEVRRQRADTEHGLAILTGRPPSSVSLPKNPLAGEPVLVPPGLPADLLRQRPDVAGAEQTLRSTCASVGVADAAFYPAFRLTGAAGFESIGLSHALDWQNRIWSIGPSVTIPLFQGGKLRADLEQAKARYDEAEATYRSAVLGAIRDVEDSLTDLHMRADAGQALDRAVKDSREYLRLTQLQYRQGIVSYLQVIDAERSLLTNELAAAQTLNLRYTSTVLLIKAIGGGWTPAALEAAKAVGPHDESGPPPRSPPSQQ
jgi:multidrug efflux system outer membrane protein